MRKFLKVILSLLMTFSLMAVLPSRIYAEESGDYEYEVLDDGTVAITTYNGSVSSLIIPSELDGYTVTTIGDSAFENCASLTSITIPDSVTTIADYVFSDCTNLTSITIPDSVTSIGWYAFENCTSLISITIPNSVVSMECGVFYGCTNLSEVNIPTNLTRILGNTFLNCTSLKSISIPESITYIGYSAFENCNQLTSITIPENVEEICNEAFKNCTKLTKIYFEGDVPEMFEYVEDNGIDKGSFDGTFMNVSAKAYYPANNSTWTSDVMKDYDGDITWVAYSGDSTMPFVDVSSSQWYYNTVKEANSLGLMTGTDETHFSPNKNMSRAMVVTVLYRMAGSPKVSITSSKFSDVKSGLWYTSAIIWATNLGIVSGYSSTKFGPEDNVTREQMAVMIRNYCQLYKKYSTSSTNTLTLFTDYKNVSSYAKTAVGWAVDKGIITGTTTKKLNPTSKATRAECAKMLLVASKLKS